MKAQQQANLTENIWRLSHCLATLLFIVWLCAAIQAAPSDLDPSFGNGGIVISPFTEFSDKPTSIQVQPDGKIIVSGYSYDYDYWCPCEYSTSGFIARYNSSGTLDASFGSNGKIIIGDYLEHIGVKTVLQPDGKIVAIGRRLTLNGAGNQIIANDFAVFRYIANGTLDASFGTGGKVFTSVGDGQFEPYNYEDPRDVVLQPDGKIVVMEFIFVNGSGYKFGIVRYNPDGSLDNNFGTDGKVITAIASNYGQNSDVDSMLLQPDGKIVLVGSYNYDILLVRYNADGSLDSGFGANGRVTYSTPSRDGGLDSVLQPDGKIVVAGYADSGSEIVRFNGNGSVDPGFAANGIFRTERSFFVGNSVALQPEGKIVAFGNASIGENGNNSGFAVARFNPNGSPDASFGTDGRLITPIGTKGASFGLTVALQPNGKIIGSGVTDASDGLGNAAIVSYLGDVASPNPIDDPQFFVRQHYLDFLDREPDASGLAYWTDRITQCGSDARCIHERRIGVSAAFFIELEFQDTGYFVYRFYKASLGRQPNYAEFTSDRSKVIGGSSVEANKQAFADEWVQRSAFRDAYPNTMSNTEVVNKLFDSAGLTASVYDRPRQQEIQALNAGRSRALVLRDVIEIPDFKNVPDPSNPRYSEIKQISQYNPAFVLMQYFGYLRRNVDPGGYTFWLDVVNNRKPNDCQGMVCAFVTSTEYQLRFGSAVTRSNADCGQ